MDGVSLRKRSANCLILGLWVVAAANGAPPPGFILDTGEIVGWRSGGGVVTGTLTADGKFRPDPEARPVSVEYERDGNVVDLLRDAPAYPPGVPSRVINYPEHGSEVWELRGDALVGGWLHRSRNGGSEFAMASLPGPTAPNPHETMPFAEYDPRTADKPIYNLPGRFEGYRRYTVPRPLRGIRLQLTANRNAICVNDPVLIALSLTNETPEPIDGNYRYIDLTILSQLRTHMFIRRAGGPWAVYSSPQREHSLRTRPDGMAFGKVLPPGGRLATRNLVLYDGARDAFVFDTPGQYDLYCSYCSTPRDVTAGMYSNEVHLRVTEVQEADRPAAEVWRRRELALYLHDHGYDRERALADSTDCVTRPESGWYAANVSLSGQREHTRYAPLLDEILGPDPNHAALPVPDDARLSIPVQMPFPEPTAYDKVVAYLAGLSPVPLRLSADVTDQVYDFYPRTIPLQQAMRRLAGRYACWIHDGDGYTLIHSNRPL